MAKISVCHLNFMELIAHHQYEKDTLDVIDKFLAGFLHVSNKVNFQNYFANKLIRWFVCNLFILYSKH